jgi:hypothetical protein
MNSTRRLFLNHFRRSDLDRKTPVLSKNFVSNGFKPNVQSQGSCLPDRRLRNEIFARTPPIPQSHTDLQAPRPATVSPPTHSNRTGMFCRRLSNCAGRLGDSCRPSHRATHLAISVLKRCLPSRGGISNSQRFNDVTLSNRIQVQCHLDVAWKYLLERLLSRSKISYPCSPTNFHDRLSHPCNHYTENPGLTIPTHHPHHPQLRTSWSPSDNPSPR